jgi:hypothetical protein
MAKTFYTDHDIEDMVKRGVMSLALNDNIVLTDLAYEKAGRLGVSLISPTAYTPPAAPVRPYLSKNAAATPTLEPAPAPQLSASPAASASQPLTTNQGITPLAIAPAASAKSADGFPVIMAQNSTRLDAATLKQRIRAAVLARSPVDPTLLNVVIDRVLTSSGIQ